MLLVYKVLSPYVQGMQGQHPAQCALLENGMEAVEKKMQWDLYKDVIDNLLHPYYNLVYYNYCSCWANGDLWLFCECIRMQGYLCILCVIPQNKQKWLVFQNFKWFLFLIFNKPRAYNSYIQEICIVFYSINMQHIDYSCIKGWLCCFPMPLLSFIYFMIHWYSSDH